MDYMDIAAEQEKLAWKLKFETSHKEKTVYFLVSLTLLRFPSFLLERKFKGHVCDDKLLRSIFDFLEENTIECGENIQQEYTKYYISTVISYQRLWLCATLEPRFDMTKKS